MGKLTPTKLGKIINRYQLDPVLANTLIHFFQSTPNLEIENIELFLQEIRLYLIANDINEVLYRDRDYTVTSNEGKLLEYYKKSNKYLPPIEQIREIVYNNKHSALTEYLEQIQQLIAKINTKCEICDKDPDSKYDNASFLCIGCGKPIDIKNGEAYCNECGYYFQFRTNGTAAIITVFHREDHNSE